MRVRGVKGRKDSVEGEKNNGVPDWRVYAFRVRVKNLGRTGLFWKGLRDCESLTEGPYYLFILYVFLT